MLIRMRWHSSLVILLSMLFVVVNVDGLSEVTIPFLLPSKEQRPQEFGAAQLAAAMINGDGSYPFTVDIIELPYNSSEWTAVQQFCATIAQYSVLGILGPINSAVAAEVALLAGSLSIPIISPTATTPTLSDHDMYPSFFRLVPSDVQQALVLLDMFKVFGWDRGLLMYSDDSYGTGARTVLVEGALSRGISLDVAPINSKDSVNSALNVLVMKNFRIVVVFLSTPYLSLLLHDACHPDWNVLRAPYAWVFSDTLEAAMASTSSGVNSYLDCLQGSLAISFIPPSDTMKDSLWQQWKTTSPANERVPASSGEIATSAFLTYDCVLFLAEAFRQAMQSSAINPRPPGSCLTATSNSSSTTVATQWDSGTKLISIMEKLTVSGSTGVITLGASHESIGKYRIRNYAPTGNGAEMREVGRWFNGTFQVSPDTQQIVWMGKGTTTPSDAPSLKGIKIWIGVIESPPFVIIAGRDGQPFTPSLDGSDGYAGMAAVDYVNSDQTYVVGGLCIGILQEIVNDLGFEPVLYVLTNTTTVQMVHTYIADGWLDMLFGDVPITEENGNVVRMSQPYFFTGLQVITSVSKNAALGHLFDFLKPFSSNLWMAVLATVFAFGFLLFLFERGFSKPFFKGFRGLLRAMFQSAVTAVQQGHWVVNTAAGQLLLFATMLVFLVLMSSYTASLSVVLVNASIQVQISSFSDLLSGSILQQYIAIIGSDISLDSIYAYLAKTLGTGISIYTDPLALATDIESGQIIAGVMEMGAAQHMEISRPACVIQRVGSVFHKYALGVAIRPNAFFGDDVDSEIVKLVESGFVDELWQNITAIDRICPVPQAQTSQLTLKSLAGVFIVWMVILFIAVIVHILDVRFRPNLRRRKRYEIRKQREQRINAFEKYKRNQQMRMSNLMSMSKAQSLMAEADATDDSDSLAEEEREREESSPMSPERGGGGGGGKHPSLGEASGFASMIVGDDSINSRDRDDEEGIQGRKRLYADSFHLTDNPLDPIVAPVQEDLQNDADVEYGGEEDAKDVEEERQELKAAFALENPPNLEDIGKKKKKKKVTSSSTTGIEKKKKKKKKHQIIESGDLEDLTKKSSILKDSWVTETRKSPQLLLIDDDDEDYERKNNKLGVRNRGTKKRQPGESSSSATATTTTTTATASGGGEFDAQQRKTDGLSPLDWGFSDQQMVYKSPNHDNSVQTSLWLSVGGSDAVVC